MLPDLIGSRLFGYLYEVGSDLVAQLHNVFLRKFRSWRNFPGGQN